MMESSPDSALDLLSSFSQQRERMLVQASRVLTASPTEWTLTDGQDASHPLSSMLLASLEELKVAEEEMYRQHEVLQSAKLELSRERDRFRVLFEEAPAALLVTDRSGAIHEVNKRAAELLGRDAYYLERKPITALLPPDERSEFRTALSRVDLTGGTTDWHFRILRRRDLPTMVTAAVTVIADARFGSALYWRLEQVQPSNE